MSCFLAVVLASSAIGQPGDFGTCTSTVPTAVNAASIKAILATKQVEKSQFETTDAYENRARSIAANISKVRLVMPVGFGLAKYDADTETLTIPPDNIAPQLQTLDDYLGLPDYEHYWFGHLVGGSASPVSHYTAENIYGKKIRVQKFDRTQIQFIFAGGRKFHQDAQPLYIKLPRATAKVAIARLRFVIEGEISAPYFIDIDREHPANYFDRVDVKTRLIGMVFKPICGTVVDAQSSAAIASFDPSALSHWYQPQ